MTASPLLSSYPRHSSQVQHRGKSLKYLSEKPHKTNVDFRESSRREDAARLWAAFPGHSQQAVAERASRALGVTDRQIINWLALKHDMPSWAVKAVGHYLRGVDRLARRIEG